eukprot:5658044-Pyramimonas_sp.AAC.1
MKDFLEDPECSAHIILCQEHRLGDPESIDRASASAMRAGWKSIWLAAVPGPQGGDSAGVAIFA